MIRILVVDEDREHLKCLMGTLAALGSDWKPCFAESGPTALGLMAKGEIDVLVCASELTGMTGGELLERSAMLYPRMLRILMTEHGSRKMLLGSARYAHQVLSRPCDPGDFRRTLEQARLLQEELNDDGLQEIVSGLTTLPSLPTLYSEIMEEISSPGGTLERVGSIIGRDVGMTAKILQLVNSAFFGLANQVSDPCAAVSLLGMDTIKALVLSTHVFAEYGGRGSNLSLVRGLWDHSVRTAAFARLVAQAENLPPQEVDSAFFAGMLHDIGRLVLFTEREADYRKVMQLHRGVAKAPFWEAERRILGAHHATVGAYLLGLWGLPSPVVEAVLCHHQPSLSSRHGFSPLLATHVADSLEYEIMGRNFRTTQGELDLPHIDALGLTGRIPVWRELCRESVENEQAA